MTPQPPECIARAITQVDWTKKYGEVVSHHEYARAVWDALLAEGAIRHIVGADDCLTENATHRVHSLYHSWKLADLLEPDGHIHRVLVIPLASQPEETTDA